MEFKEVKVGNFVYKVLENPVDIKKHLLNTLEPELIQDQSEHPDQPWTPEWLEIVKGRSFSLVKMDLDKILPRTDLMSWKTSTYSFATELESRVADSKENLLANPIIEPLVIVDESMELMDGHMRYTLLKELGETEVYVYIASK